MVELQVEGRIVDASSLGQPGYRVELLDLADPSMLPLADQETNAGGTFVLTADVESLDSLWHVMVFTPVGVIVAERNVAGGAATVDIGDVEVRSAFRFPIRQGNNIQLCIDNAVAWETLARAIEAVQHEALGCIFQWDPSTVVSFGPGDERPINDTDQRLQDLLFAANRPPRSVKVYLIVRKHPFPFSKLETSDEVKEVFENEPNHSIEFRFFETDGRLPLHTKHWVLDNREAHIVASPLTQHYYDNSFHELQFWRRGSDPWNSFHELQFWSSDPWPATLKPVHDVSLRLTGPVVDDLKETFDLLWEEEGTARPDPTPNIPDLPFLTPAVDSELVRNVPIRVSRSLPANRLGARPGGEIDILQEYLTAIGIAERLIYVENQYVLEPVVIDAIARRLEECPQLHVVGVLNKKVDIPGHNSAQWHELLYLNSEYAGRVHLYTIWTAEESADGKLHLLNVYVHSKVCVVDDVWATVGSANLDGISMYESPHFDLTMPELHARLELHRAVRVFEGRRSVEVNVTLFNGVFGQPASVGPRVLLEKLLFEHAGVDAPPADGDWESLLWQKAKVLKGAVVHGDSLPDRLWKPRLLPWVGMPDSESYVRVLLASEKLNQGAIELRMQGIVIHDSADSFDLQGGNWQ